MYTVGQKSDDIKLLQRALNEILVTNLVTDGVYGKSTSGALEQYQKRQALPVTGTYDTATQNKIEPYIATRFLTVSDLDKAATDLGVAASIIKAVREVEGLNAGFNNNKTPIILFERHRFYMHIAKKKGDAFASELALKYPNICNPTAGGYLTPSVREYERYGLARNVDLECAQFSCSWGMFQIMGSNYRSCGYGSVGEMVKAVEGSEKNQLHAFVNFIKAEKGIHVAMKARDFDKIAELYNGKSKVAAYSALLRKAEAKYR